MRKNHLNLPSFFPSVFDFLLENFPPNSLALKKAIIGKPFGGKDLHRWERDSAASLSAEKPYGILELTDLSQGPRHYAQG